MESVISLEDRLLVALASRDEERIGQVVVNALALAGLDLHDLYGYPDRALVRVVEEYVFYPSGTPVMPAGPIAPQGDANHSASSVPSASPSSSSADENADFVGAEGSRGGGSE